MIGDILENLGWLMIWLGLAILLPVVLLRAIDPEGWARAVREVEEEYEQALQDERDAERRRQWEERKK